MGLEKVALCAGGKDGAGASAMGGLGEGLFAGACGGGGGVGVWVDGTWDGLNAGGGGGDG